MQEIVRDEMNWEIPINENFTEVNAQLADIVKQLDGVELTEAGYKNLNSGNFPIESGTWTPQLMDNIGNYPTQTSSGTWRKQGKIIHVDGVITLTARGTFAGDNRITLPTPAKVNFLVPSINCSLVNFPSERTQVSAMTVDSGMRLRIQATGSNVSTVGLSGVSFADNSVIYITLDYEIS